MNNTTNKTVALEEFLEKGLSEHIDVFYTQLLSKYSTVGIKEFTVIDDNSWYLLCYFPSTHTLPEVRQLELESSVDEEELNTTVTTEEPEIEEESSEYFGIEQTSTTPILNFDFEKYIITLNKLRAQPKLACVYEIKKSAKGERVTRSNSVALGYLLLTPKTRVFKLEKDYILLEDKEIALPLNQNVELEKDIIKPIKTLEPQIVEVETKPKKNKQAVKILPYLLSVATKDSSREYLSFV